MKNFRVFIIDFLKGGEALSSVKKVFAQLPVRLELEGELLPGQVLIEVFDFHRVLIENHDGVTKFDPNEIIINSPKGKLYVYGKFLQLAKMGKRQLVITGQIHSVSIDGERNS